jgi:hypothetical protein
MDLNLKKEDVKDEWGQMRNEEIYYLFSSDNVISELKSRRIRQSRHEEIKNT